MERITRAELARNLDRQTSHIPGEPPGIQGLNILIYGWLRCRNYGKAYRKAVANRDWLYVTEVHDLSDYAGYDLTASVGTPQKYEEFHPDGFCKA